jgi:ribonuclease P protein component
MMVLMSDESCVSSSGGFRFPREMRLRSASDFRAAYDANVRSKAGPLLVYARPNGLEHARLGLAIARRVGGAVRRHRLKRHLREAFRLLQRDLPPGYDFIISAQPHDELSLADYQTLLARAATELDRKWRKKQ